MLLTGLPKTGYTATKGTARKTRLVVWRFHDYMHALRPDGVQMGVLQALGWEAYYNATKPHLLTLPQTTLQDIVALAKKQASYSACKNSGRPEDTCSRVVLIPGAAGGRMQMQALMQEQPDLLIVGDKRMGNKRVCTRPEARRRTDLPDRAGPYTKRRTRYGMLAQCSGRTARDRGASHPILNRCMLSAYDMAAAYILRGTSVLHCRIPLWHTVFTYIYFCYHLYAFFCI
jgi:hypothetical protein